MYKTLTWLLLLIAPAAFADSKTYVVKAGDKSTAEFHAEDSYDAFDGATNRVTGAIVADAANVSASSVTLSVDMNSLDTGVSLRNREMRERYLQTPKFPEATFKSKSVEGAASVAPNAPADIKVTGEFSLHGVTKAMTIPVRVVLLPDGRIHATSQFAVHMPDFGISVPRNVLVTVNDDVPVRLDVWATAK